MLFRFIAAAVILLSATLPASALTPNGIKRPADQSLAAAADRMKVKDYRGAREAALKSSDQGNEKGTRAFLLGMAALRLELWDEAASNLAVAVQYYPILGDYALYNQGLALSKAKRPDQALDPLYKVLKEYPDSRLARPAMILYADTLAATNHHKEALDSYASFVERYPSGGDSISALFGSALCREKLGDPAAAAAIFRKIWLKYPASPFAEKAAAELQTLAAAGTQTAPYSSAELLTRGGTLYQLRRYRRAAKVYAEIPTAGESEAFAVRLRLKTGQALYKARKYQDAQAIFSGIVQSQGGSAAAEEATLWLARILEKSHKSPEAYDLLIRTAESAKEREVASEALLEAAYIKRFQRNWDQALQLFRKYLAGQPDQKKSPTVLWETAWAAYQSRDYQGAAADFRRLSGSDDLRDKALYWLAKSLIAAGDAKGAEAPMAALAAEYPFGYYALICNRWCEPSQSPLAPRSLNESLPMPAGFEREKALISLGLYDEAARELALVRRKKPLGAARLYLEMENYNGALHSAAYERPKRGEKDSPTLWGLNYPLAFSEAVAKNASANALPENLVYAIMRTESNYHPGALSPVGAVGLMQIMPTTAESISKGGAAGLTTPDLNIKLGARHLKDLMNLFDRNLTLVIAAYNAGSGNVSRWQKGLAGLPRDEFIESIPFRETREYVKKVMTAMELYQRLYRAPADKPL